MRMPGHLTDFIPVGYPDEGCEHCPLRDCKYNGYNTKGCPYRPEKYKKKEDTEA